MLPHGCSACMPALYVHVLHTLSKNLIKLAHIYCHFIQCSDRVCAKLRKLAAYFPHACDRAGGLLQIVQHSEGNAASAMAPAACPAGSFMLSGTAHRESPVLVEARQRASAYALATPHRKSAAYDIFAPPADGKAESETDTSSHSSTETADTDGVGSSANSDAGVVSDANSGVLHSLSRQALERLGRVSGQAYDVDSQEPAVAATQCNSPGSDTEASSTWRGSECQDSSGLDQAEFVQLSSRPRYVDVQDLL